jgi:rRNA maturation RNase YbeY
LPIYNLSELFLTKVNFIFEHLPDNRLSKKEFKGKVKMALRIIEESENMNLESVNLRITDDESVREFNKSYLNHDYYTDVITFDYNDGTADVMISSVTVLKNAENYSVSFSNELLRVVIHSFLHLAGYDDISLAKQKIMKLKEDHYLKVVETITF